MAASVPTLDLYNMIGGIGDVLAKRNDLANAQAQATYQQGLTQALLDPNGVPPAAPVPQSFLQRLIGGLSGEQPAVQKAAPMGPAGAPAAAPSTTATVPGARPALPTSNALHGAIIGQESGGNPNIGASIDGAQGIGQIMPATFARYAQPGERIDNPADNLAVSKRITDTYLQKYGDPQRAAVAYFSGEGNVAPPGSPTPYLRDVKDGNGKSVSSYVSDVTRRMGGAAPTPTAAPVESVGTTVTPNGHVIPDYSLQRINAMIGNPATKVLGEALLKRYLENTATSKWEAPTRDDFGNIVQRNSQTGEVKVLSGAKSPITLSEGQTAFDPVTGRQIAVGSPKQDIESKNLQREAEADRLGLKGEDRTQYIVNGRIPTGAEKQTGEQANAATFATRMFESNKIVSDPAIYGSGLGAQGIARNISAAIPGIGNMLVPDEYQMYDQAKRDFVNAVLRKESGAAISQGEFDNAEKQYFPRPGDSEKVIAQKAKNRDTAIRVIANSASPSFREQFFGTKTPEIIKRDDAKQRQSLPQGYTPAMAVDEAKKAIAAGKDPAAIAERLKGYGIDPAIAGIR